MASFREVLSEAESAEIVRLLEKLTAHMRAFIAENEAAGKTKRTAVKPRRVRVQA
jgi:hypothetical protein